MSTINQSTLHHKIASWLNPILLVVIGYFGNMEITQVNRKLDEIITLKVNDATQEAEINALNVRLTRVENTVVYKHTADLPGVPDKNNSKNSEIIAVIPNNKDLIKSTSKKKRK